MIAKYKYLYFFFVIITITSCKVSEKTTIPRNLQRIYNPASTSLHPEIEVYNISDSNSLIVEKVFSKELLYNKANDENKLLARVLIKYNLYEINNKQKLIDSLTTTFKFDKNTDKSSYICEIPVIAIKGKDYLLEIITIDQNRNSRQFAFFRVSRSNDFNSQDFLIYDKNNKDYLTSHFIKNRIPFGIKHYKESFDSLNVFYFKKNEFIPEPPHIKDTIQEDFINVDSVFVCHLDSIKYEKFLKEGVYYFTSDEKPVNGVALYNFGSGFPIVQTPDQLFKPLKYLGNNELIPENDSTGKLTKLAVDNFWLERTNNVNKSRELLKEYYRRVTFANTYFTSFKEGWQTDRGMIYIVLGLPDYLYKAEDEERWIYNPTSIGPGISFSFKYRKSLFSLNHYVLERDKVNTGWDWDEAVKMWNSGEVFYYQN